MRIYLASDHAGFELKEALIPFLRERGHEVEDVGPTTFDPADDYPDYVLPMAAKVAQNKGSFGIGIGGSGQGEAMVANRVKGARAAVYYGGKEEIIKLSREHNDANILSIGARFVSSEEAKKVVELWLGTPFSNEERHTRRLSKLGFTIIELLIVIAVIGILASIVVVGVNQGRAAAQDARRKSDLENIKTLLTLYAQDYGDYVGAGSGCGSSGSGNGWFNYTNGTSYLKSIMQCLIDKGFASQEIIDPTGGRSSTASTETFAYMKYTCSAGTYLYAKLKTLPYGSSVESDDVNNSCSGAVTYDTAYGMNYVVKVR